MFLTLRNIILAGLSLFLFSLIVLLVFISLKTDKTSEKLIKARSELALGNKDRAYDIYFSIISSDTSCEEAYRALAEIAEERVNYKDSAYFWMMISNLNPLDINAKCNYFRAMIISGADTILQLRFELLSDSSFMPDSYIYAIAKSYVRLGKRQNIEGLKKYVERSSYKRLLDALLYISARNYASAQNEFNLALLESKSDIEKYDSMIGLASVSLLNGEVIPAKELLAKINTDNPILNSDVIALQASIAEWEEDVKTAVAKYIELAKYKRYLVAPIIQGVDLAAITQDLDALAKFKGLFETKDKLSLELFYYISAHEFFIKGDWKQAYEKLTASGNFSQSISGKILELKCISKLGSYASASVIASNLAKYANQISQTDKVEIVKVLSEILNQNRDDDSLLDSLLIIAPENPFANLLNMHRKFEKRDFYASFNSAKLVLEKLGYSASIFNIACVSAMALGNYDDVLAIANQRLTTNPNDTSAILFLARANVGKRDKQIARKLYMQVVKMSEVSAPICAEVANFMLDNNFLDDFFVVLNVIEASKQKDNKILSLFLKSKYEKLRGDKLQRIKILNRAYDLDKTSESLLCELISAYADAGTYKEILTITDEFLQNKNSPMLLFTMASVIRNGGRSYCEKSIQILQKLAQEYPVQANIFLELSKSYKKLEMYNEALVSARKAVDLAPSNVSAVLNLGEILAHKDLYEEAIATLERVFQQQKSEKIEKLLVDVLVEFSKQSDVKLDRRISLLKKALKLHPNNKSILSEISRLEMMSKK